MTGVVPVGPDHFALVDDEDYDRVMAAGPWHLRCRSRNHYAQCHVLLLDGRRTTQQMHRLITEWAEGVDHRNNDGLDNRKSNLRPSNQSQNTANGRLCVTSSTGYKGVTKPRAKRSFVAQIRVHGKQTHLGSFVTAEEAARCYDAAALEAFGEFARINFPKETAA